MAEIVSDSNKGPGIAYEFERGVEDATEHVVAKYPQARLFTAMAESPTPRGVPTIYQLSKMTVRFRESNHTLTTISQTMYNFGPIKAVTEVVVGQDLLQWPPFISAESAQDMARELGLKSNILSLEVFRPMEGRGEEKWTFRQVDGEPVTVSATIMN